LDAMITRAQKKGSWEELDLMPYSGSCEQTRKTNNAVAVRERDGKLESLAADENSQKCLLISPVLVRIAGTNAQATL